MNKNLLDMSADETLALLRTDGEVGGESKKKFQSERFLDENVRLLEKWNLPLSHRGGFFGRIMNFFIRKFSFLVKLFLKPIISAQELFNRDVAKKMNGLLTANDFDLDYEKFEARFRGAEEDIKSRQLRYLDYLKNLPSGELVDFGCGRGEFLELLRSAGFSAFGVENYPSFCRRLKLKGLRVVEMEALKFLHQVRENEFAAISAFHLIEHLTRKNLSEFLRLIFKSLKPGGVLLLESPNPKCLGIFAASFYMDFSHVYPVHPEALKFVLEDLGFSDVRIEYSGFFPDSERLEESSEMNEVQRRNLQKMNKLLFGAQDYSIVARK